MIDHARKPLAKIDAFGFFWHGYYDGSWRNRAGAVMSGFPPTAPMGAVASYKLGILDAHLVDFGMPTVSTPTAESTLGMERWNKNILHGQQRSPGIFSAKGFTKTGWPYRAPDGTVWFLRMSNTGTTCQVKAIKLTTAFAVPTAVIASITVPTIVDGTAGPLENVNFAPDGSKAAGHSYYSNFAAGSFYENSYPAWIVEAAVSGGSASTAPTVTLSLTDLRGDDGSASLLVSPTVPEKMIVWTGVGGATYETVNATTRWKLTEAAPTWVDHPTNTRDLYSTAQLGYRRYMLLVSYAADGSRRTISFESDIERIYNTDDTVMFAQNHIRADLESWNGSAWVPASGAGISYKQRGGILVHRTSDLHITLQILRSKTTVVSFDAFERTTIADGGSMSIVGLDSGYQSWNPGGFVPYSPGVSLPSPTTSGNGWTGTGTTLMDESTKQLLRITGNVVAFQTHPASPEFYAWCGPITAGQWSVSAPFIPSSGFFPAINPDTGALNVNARLYF